MLAENNDGLGREAKQGGSLNAVSRRTFITGACAAGALAAMGGLAGCAASPEDSGQGVQGGSGTGTNGDAVPGNAAPSSVDKL
ncbi:MAG: twin-arginine translocation signal domain-containing protein [Eggerthellaceae bacterium]